MIRNTLSPLASNDLFDCAVVLSPVNIDCKDFSRNDAALSKVGFLRRDEFAGVPLTSAQHRIFDSVEFLILTFRLPQGWSISQARGVLWAV